MTVLKFKTNEKHVSAMKTVALKLGHTVESPDELKNLMPRPIKSELNKKGDDYMCLIRLVMGQIFK